MPVFQQRSYQKELLDGTAIPFDAIQQNMAELNFINHYLGGHRITLKGIRAFLLTMPKERWHIVEIGCGGGDNLQVIQKWASKKGIQVSLTGVDINKECIAFAKTCKENAGIHFMVSDYKEAEFSSRPDIIFSSLFCHHFTDEELTAQLQWMKTNSSKGFFINDLHRHPIAYYSIKWLTKLFSKSYLVKNDAPLSVLRGFRKKEWQLVCEKAGISFVTFQWCWAFRWLIIYFK